MNLGLSTYSFPWSFGISGFEPTNPMQLEELLQYTCCKGISYLQIADNYPLHLLPYKELDSISKSALDKGIFLQVGMRGLTPKRTLNYLTIAKRMHSPFLRVVIDEVGYSPSPEEIVQCIRQLLPFLRDNGIVLAIENHDRLKAETLADIIDKTDPEFVGICLDTANSLGAGEGIAAIAPILLPYTVNVHIKDFIIKRVTHKMGFTVSGTPAGEGMLDVEWLVALCKNYPRCKTATLELWLNETGTIATTIKKEKDWVNKSIQFLKNYI